MKKALFFLLLAINLFAINCGDFTGEFKTYNGHYYAITGNKMSFQNAKNFAQANNGYLAIPNTLAENNFIKGIVGSNNEAWIGIYDPNYTQSLCFTNNCYSTSRSRFKTVQGASLSYQNWDSIDVENQFMENDDTVNKMGKPLITTLGEHWALLSGNTGLWRDWGTHFFTGENPAIQKAMIEFDTKPTCYEAPSPITGEITGRVCNSQVWDTVMGVSDGTTAQCLSDVNNVEYCPQSLAQCGSSWDYDNGYSVSGVGTVTDYTNKISTTNIQNVSSTCQRSTEGLIPESPAGQWYSYVPAWAGSNGAGWQVYINKVGPTTYKIYYRLEAYYKWTSWRTAYAEEGTTFQDSYYNRGDYGGFRVDFKTAVFYGLHPKTLGQVAMGDLENMPVCKSCGLNLPATELTQTSLTNLGGMGWLLSTYLGGSTVYIELSSDKTRYFYKIQAGNGGMKTGTGTLSGTISDSSYYNDGKWDYSINFELTSSYIRIGQYGAYSQVYRFNDLVCFSNTSNCPANYIETTGSETSLGECKTNQNYTYYTYLCNSGYTPINSGGNTGKTDPNATTTNTLTSDLNSSTPPLNNCKKERFTCLANAQRPCALVDNKMQCSPFPCVGSSDFENLGTVEGQNDKNNSGWNNEGSCAGQLYIFNGEDKRCRLKDKFFGLTGGGCCDKDKVFMGLIACKDNEKILAKKKNNDLCHYVGQHCSKKLKFLGCIQTSESYCCFSSKLGRIIHEQGRPQLGISWGSGDSPNCRGFTPDEFQKLDFSKLDFTEFAKDIQTKTTNFNNIGGFVQNKVQNFFQQ